MAANRKRLVLIIHDIRSAHNVGSMFRTADGAGVDEIILTGFTPCPPKKGALYQTAADKALKKTALGAEEYVPWKTSASLARLIGKLKKEGYEMLALEQCEGSVRCDRYRPKGSVALIVGNEVLGVDRKTLKAVDSILEIPMRGRKNSLNVSVAAGIALYGIADRMRK